MSTTRRSKWHPPPPPSPKILHLPRRTRRKATKQVTVGKSVAVKESDSLTNHREKLETLLDKERSFSRTVPIVLLNTGDSERRERVDEFDYRYREKGRDFEDEKWKFQAEILRAECQFLRMEREIALKKLEKSRTQMQRTLRSGRKRIYEGKNVGVVLEKEIEDLEEKLEELQKSEGLRDFDIRKCCNFDKRAAVLQRRLERLGGGVSEEESFKEIREMAEASLTISKNYRSDDCFVFKDVEILGRKMEGLSKGMLQRMEEEYSSMLSTATTSASTSSSSSKSKRIQFPDSSSPSSSSSTRIRHHSQHGTREWERGCSGRCKSIVRKIVEQVRAETEQWSQMQEMLGQVRDEMEELQVSRDFWEDRAFHCEDRIRSFHSSAQEWRQKASSSENMVTELQKQISELRIKLERLSTEQQKEPPRTRGLRPPIPRDTQKEKEKRVLICRLKENHHNMGSRNLGKQNHNLDDDGKRRTHSCGGGHISTTKRSPLKDVGNSSPLLNKQSCNRPSSVPFVLL